ncbi:ArsR family transcriptional regulator [Streptomyces sp. NPDC060184]|uniref:ArsR family transcriptional regulator n=1 Tax=Streptomyces sp. NPDC060184 TaxID=3347064 RepID=UPI0036496267
MPGCPDGAPGCPVRRPGPVPAARGCGPVRWFRPPGSGRAGRPESTLSHHLKTLREAGLVRNVPQGRQRSLTLRRDDLDARFPGLLDAVLQGAGARCPACRGACRRLLSAPGVVPRLAGWRTSTRSQCCRTRYAAACTSTWWPRAARSAATRPPRRPG